MQTTANKQSLPPDSVETVAEGKASEAGKAL